MSDEEEKTSNNNQNKVLQQPTRLPIHMTDNIGYAADAQMQTNSSN